MKKSPTFRLVLASLFTAIGVLLPSVFHTFGISGSIFLPMHIPVFLCGMVCGWQYGAICGILVPLLCSFTGMPPLFPTAISMACELATYGFVSGLLIQKCKPLYTLIAAMITGRVVMGLANTVLLGMSGKTYALSAFLSGAFVVSAPGSVVQLVLVPLLVTLLQKAGIAPKYTR